MDFQMLPELTATATAIENTDIQPRLDAEPLVRPLRASKPVEKGSLFRVVWRWHFYAGVFVAPFLVTLAATGALYVFMSEIEMYCRSNWMVVSVPETPAHTYQEQLDAAKKAFPDYSVASIKVLPEKNRATEFSMRKPTPPGEGGQRGFGRGGSTVYVDPYTNNVTGQLTSENDSLQPFFRTVLSVHRNLFIGTTGRVITELATSWTIILLVTGAYLWIPKNWSKSAGVWVPRLDKKRYTALRDLHAISGIYLFPVALTIAVTGMFYTLAVGKVVHDGSHYIKGIPFEQPVARQQQVRSEQNRSQAENDQKTTTRKEGSAKSDVQKPASVDIAQNESSGRSGRRNAEAGSSADAPKEAPARPVMPPLPVDQIVAKVRAEYPDRIVTVQLSEPRGRRGGGPPADPNAVRVGAGNDYNATYGLMVNTNMTVDRKTTEITSRQHNHETEYFWHALTYPLHVGSIYGTATKIVWFLACLVMMAMPVTGLWMWWERRPKGKSGLPKRQEVRIPIWLMVTIGVFCVFLPIAGASVLLVLLLEGVYRLIRRNPSRPVGVT